MYALATLLANILHISERCHEDTGSFQRRHHIFFVGEALIFVFGLMFGLVWQEALSHLPALFQITWDTNATVQSQLTNSGGLLSALFFPMLGWKLLKTCLPCYRANNAPTSLMQYVVNYSLWVPILVAHCTPCSSPQLYCYLVSQAPLEYHGLEVRPSSHRCHAWT